MVPCCLVVQVALCCVGIRVGMPKHKSGASWFHNRPHYLTEQCEIDAKMRAILVDWLVEARWLQDAG